ncbi:MAG: ATP-binding protein [Candidatus Aminicenantes bacterium]|nr:MAG: ATP-binding protein [Candidatus Aminicenantes bacterium]
MNTYVKSIDIDLFDGILRGSIDFTEGINILSGENGTCKTQVLREIKVGKKIQSSTDANPRIQAFSPKRNSERKNIERILQEIHQPNRQLRDYIKRLTQAALQDNTFESYAPFGEVYFLVHEEERKDGRDQIVKMTKVTDDFNGIIRRIFENYELVSDWDYDRGSPNIRLKKNNTELPIESLSLGEQEIMSLVINLYASREAHDVFVIDEPEIHLNWHLEEKLFQFLDWFCNEYKKQVIVATHSRVVFTSHFISKTQFLFWENGHIIVGKNIPDEIRTRIAGESIDIIKVGSFSKVTFLVEDDMQVQVIQVIAEILKCDVACQSLGNRNNIRSLYKFSLLEGKWANCFFVEDGDNEGNPFPGEAKFIHLDKYCVENYLLDLSTAAKVVNQSEDFIRNAILNAIKENKSPMVKRNKFFNFFTSMLDSLTISNIDESSISVLDGSTIYDSFLKELNIAPNDYMKKYLQVLYDEKRLDIVFPNQLISAIS